MSPPSAKGIAAASEALAFAGTGICDRFERRRNPRLAARTPALAHRPLPDLLIGAVLAARLKVDYVQGDTYRRADRSALMAAKPCSCRRSIVVSCRRCPESSWSQSAPSRWPSSLPRGPPARAVALFEVSRRGIIALKVFITLRLVDRKATPCRSPAPCGFEQKRAIARASGLSIRRPSRTSGVRCHA